MDHEERISRLEEIAAQQQRTIDAQAREISDMKAAAPYHFALGGSVAMLGAWLGGWLDRYGIRL